MNALSKNSSQDNDTGLLRAPLRGMARAGAASVLLIAAAGAWAQAGLVNINTASPEALSENLSGVGLAKAYRIVEYREAHGPFEHIDELAEVSGIGEATVERNRGRIAID